MQDFKTYSERNRRENLPRVTKFLHMMPTSKSLFIHCMWEWSLTDPSHVDLKTVTISDMITLSSPVIKVRECVIAGYLKKVTGYDSLDNSIQA